MSQSGNCPLANVIGVVLDAENDESLPFVNVTGCKTGMNSDFNGLFCIELRNEKCELTFGFVGYEAFVVEDVSPGDSLVVRLVSGKIRRKSLRANATVERHKRKKPTSSGSTVDANHDRQSPDIEPPEITLIYPTQKRGIIRVEPNSWIAVVGQVTDESQVGVVLINEEMVQLDEFGKFNFAMEFGNGDQSLVIEAWDSKSNKAIREFQIAEKGSDSTAEVVEDVGKFYALIIGNNDYSDPAIDHLSHPAKDAEELAKILTEKYSFAPENVTLIKNASFEDILGAFDQFSDKVTSSDSFLVFYGGHGEWDDRTRLGYWLPVDAKKDKTAHWVRNSTICDYMGGIDSRHTLLISDACFSGSILNTRSAFDNANRAVKSLHELPSRSVMTSGYLSVVPDESTFMKYLMKKLITNDRTYLPADQLFTEIRTAIMNNSETEPQFGTIRNAGDEGGEFLFIRK